MDAPGTTSYSPRMSSGVIVFHDIPALPEMRTIVSLSKNCLLSAMWMRPTAWSTSRISNTWPSFRVIALLSTICASVAVFTPASPSPRWRSPIPVARSPNPTSILCHSSAFIVRSWSTRGSRSVISRTSTTAPGLIVMSPISDDPTFLRFITGFRASRRPSFAWLTSKSSCFWIGPAAIPIPQPQTNPGRISSYWDTVYGMPWMSYGFACLPSTLRDPSPAKTILTSSVQYSYTTTGFGPGSFSVPLPPSLP